MIVFLPTLHAEVSLIDDSDMLNWLLHADPDMSLLRQILIPGGSHGGYYRPLVILSFLSDKLFFSVNPVVMHLEGILFHLFNSFLVFFLTRICLQPSVMPLKKLLPLYAALLFGLHPITTESVNWISGRTDIMMGNFVLLGAILLMRYKLSGQIRYMISALCAVLIGVLAKEAAFGCLAGGVLLCTAGVFEDSGTTTTHDGGSPVIDFMIFFSIAFLAALLMGNYWVVVSCLPGYWFLTMYRRSRNRSESLKNHIAPFLIIVMVLSLSAVLFFLLRRMAFTSDAGKIGNTIRLMYMDPSYSISLFIGAMGFYIQKFIFPWPLNFFILEIDPLYDFAGIAVVLIMMRLLTINTISTALFFIGAGMIVPVLPFVFATIAWTGYAERYIYLPAAFWCTALAVAAAQMHEMTYCRQRPYIRLLFAVVIPTVILIFSVTTWKRNIVWQKNVTLLHDTVDKSPRVKPLRDFYMAALYNAGRYEEAAQQYEIGKSLYSRIYDTAPDLMMAKILQSRNKINEAYRLYEKANVAAGFRSETLLRATIDFLERVPTDVSFALSKPEIREQLLSYRSKLEKLNERHAADKLHRMKGSLP